MDIGRSSTSLYNNRRKSEPPPPLASQSPEKYPKDVKELVEKKIASEYQFNQHARVRRAKSQGVHNSNESRRNSISLTDRDIKQLKMKYQRHHGDENMTDSDLGTSRIFAEERFAASESSSNDKGYDSDLETLPQNVSPMMIRRHSHSQENPQIGNKIDIHLAKLAQMKLKLDPLPNRRRTKSLIPNGS